MKLEKRLVGLHAEIDFNPYLLYAGKYGTPEYWKKYEEAMLREEKDFRDFVRDHRSRDEYGVSIIKDYKMYCPFCEHEYPDEFNGIADCCDEMIKSQGVEINLK